MTNFTTRMMMVAVATAVTAGVASAQAMKAEIPFAFRAGGKLMAAGSYRVYEMNRNTGAPVFRLANADNAAMVAPAAAHDAKKSWQPGRPVLSFECGGSHCALAGVWTADGGPAYSFRRPKLGKDEPVRMTTVTMRPDKAE